MISKGSLVAPLRKVELSQLEQKLSSFTPASELPEIQESSTMEDEIQHQVQGEQEHEDHAIIDETGWYHFAANAMAGLSPRELLDLAEQLDVDCLLYPPEM